MKKQKELTSEKNGLTKTVVDKMEKKILKD